MDDNLRAIRKSIIATSAFAVVLRLSGGSGVDWAVNLSGPATWGLLLVAHVYYYAMWYSYGRRFVYWSQAFRPSFIIGWWRTNSHTEKGYIADWSVTHYVAILGLGIIALNLLCAAKGLCLPVLTAAQCCEPGGTAFLPTRL